MSGLAAFRIGLGAAAWLAPRAIALGVGYLASSGEARDVWHRLWLLCDAADTAMGARMVARRELATASGAAALLTTGGALAIDLAAIGAQP